MFLQEACLMAALPHHPNLVACCGFVTCDTTGLVGGVVMEAVVFPWGQASSTLWHLLHQPGCALFTTASH
jgi:hypothetical protein